MGRFTVADLNSLAELTAAMITPEQMEQFAVAAARIGEDYSLRNRFLMWAQNPDVACVAGFHAWKDRGRKVRKGGRGLAILAPVTRKAKDAESGEGEGGNGEQGPADAPRRMVGVRVTYVFDIAQTEPIEACPKCPAGPGQGCEATACTSAGRGELTASGARPTSEEIAELLTDLTSSEEEGA